MEIRNGGILMHYPLELSAVFSFLLQVWSYVPSVIQSLFVAAFATMTILELFSIMR